MSKPLPSPCINVCEMEADSGLCRGCLRTLDEIVAWGSMPEDGKRAVWALLRQRRIRRREPKSARTP